MRTLAFGVFLSVLFAAHGARPDGAFLPLGGLSDDLIRSEAESISADGNVVVGSSGSDQGTQAFRWSLSTGLVGIGDLPGGSVFSKAVDVSHDGSTIAGTSHSHRGLEPFRWTASGGLEPLGQLPGTVAWSEATGISGDGSTVVGWGKIGSSWWRAFRWTRTDGMVNLGDLPGGDNDSFSYATSWDGSVVVGQASGARGREAFLWEADAGMIGLGDFPRLVVGNASRANDMSDDGSIIVGSGNANPFHQSFPAWFRAARWVDRETPTQIAGLEGVQFSEATAVSADGSVVVGRAVLDSKTVAFIWDEQNGMRDLGALLEAHGADLSAWPSLEAWGVSRDGSRVVGTAWKPGTPSDPVPRGPEAWIAFVPPASRPVEIEILARVPLATLAKRRGVLPIVLLGSATFDVADVELASLRFGPGEARPAHALEAPSAWRGHYEDRNEDGRPDLMLHFRVGEIEADGESHELCLEGVVLGLGSLRGCDALVGRADPSS